MQKNGLFQSDVSIPCCSPEITVSNFARYLFIQHSIQLSRIRSSFIVTFRSTFLFSFPFYIYSFDFFPFSSHMDINDESSRLLSALLDNFYESLRQWGTSVTCRYDANKYVPNVLRYAFRVKFLVWDKVNAWMDLPKRKQALWFSGDVAAILACNQFPEESNFSPK